MLNFRTVMDLKRKVFLELHSMILDKVKGLPQMLWIQVLCCATLSHGWWNPSSAHKINWSIKISFNVTNIIFYYLFYKSGIVSIFSENSVKELILHIFFVFFFWNFLCRFTRESIEVSFEIRKQLRKITQ